MKLKPSIAFNDFSGSAGNVTARKIGEKTYLSSRTKHSRKKTPFQAERRCRFGDTSRSYADLTDEQRQGWISLANNLGNYTTSTGSNSVTGHNLFVSINTYRKICGKPLTADAPQQLLPSRYINVGEFWISPEHIVFSNVALNENSNDVFLVEMYPAQSPAETRSWDKTVIVAVVPKTDWGEVDLTEAFLRKFGTPLKIGQKLFIKVCKIDSECGYIKWFSLIGYPARETSYLNGRVFTPRPKIKMENIEPVTQDYECEKMDYEISSGSKITSNEITARCLRGGFVSFEILHKGLPAAFNYERSFQYARATADYNYFIQCLEVKVFNNSLKKISIYCFAGIFRKHLESFGTYFITN